MGCQLDFSHSHLESAPANQSMQRDDNSYLESALSKKNITHAHNFPVLPTIFQNINYDVLENCGQYWKIVGMGNIFFT